MFLYLPLKPVVTFNMTRVADYYLFPDSAIVRSCMHSCTIATSALNYCSGNNLKNHSTNTFLVSYEQELSMAVSLLVQQESGK